MTDSKKRAREIAEKFHGQCIEMAAQIDLMQAITAALDERQVVSEEESFEAGKRLSNNVVAFQKGAEWAASRNLVRAIEEIAPNDEEISKFGKEPCLPTDSPGLASYYRRQGACWLLAELKRRLGQ